jgi:putative DNA primase/helicase
MPAIIEDQAVIEPVKASTQGKTSKKGPKLIQVPYDVVAKEIMKKIHIITIEDTKEMLVYKDGFYQAKGATTYLERRIIIEHDKLFYNYNKDLIDVINENSDEGFHITAPKLSYRNEVMNYIKIHTVKDRDQLDALSSHIINLKNGMVDVYEGKLLPHDPFYLSIRQIPINYNPDSKCPNISKFLTDVVSENDAKVLIEFAGYSLIPNTRFQKAIMLYGEGANGKSVYLKLITKFIGDENVSGVSLQSLENDKFKVANLYGKLLNIYPDLKDQAIYHSDIFKTLVGGDRIQGEKKYMDCFEFYNTARLMFSANKIPEIKNSEFAYFRRWMLINFPNQFEEGKNDDKHLFEKLTTEEELSGFLILALEGLRNILINEKFSYDLTIENVAQLYKSHSSSVSSFAETCLIMSIGSTLKTTMYQKYVEWCTAKNLKPVASNEFGKKFKQLGYEDSQPYDKLTQKKMAQWDNVVINYEMLRVEMGMEPIAQEW